MEPQIFIWICTKLHTLINISLPNMPDYFHRAQWIIYEKSMNMSKKKCTQPNLLLRRKEALGLETRPSLFLVSVHLYDQCAHKHRKWKSASHFHTLLFFHFPTHCKPQTVKRLQSLYENTELFFNDYPLWGPSRMSVSQTEAGGSWVSVLLLFGP